MWKRCGVVCGVRFCVVLEWRRWLRTKLRTKLRTSFLRTRWVAEGCAVRCAIGVN